MAPDTHRHSLPDSRPRDKAWALRENLPEAEEPAAAQPLQLSAPYLCRYLCIGCPRHLPASRKTLRVKGGIISSCARTTGKPGHRVALSHLCSVPTAHDRVPRVHSQLFLVPMAPLICFCTALLPLSLFLCTGLQECGGQEPVQEYCPAASRLPMRQPSQFSLTRRLGSSCYGPGILGSD